PRMRGADPKKPASDAAGGLRAVQCGRRVLPMAMQQQSVIRQPSAVIPLAMSFAALALVVWHIASVGVARQADEGTEAHLWQLLMAGQLPVIAYFAASSLPKNPRQSVLVLGLQAAAGLAAVAPVYLLHW